MRSILRFIIQYQFLVVFLLLEIVSFSLIVRYNHYHRVEYINIIQQWHASIAQKKQNIIQYLKLKNINDRLIRENEQLLNQIAFYRNNQVIKATHSEIDRYPYRFISAQVINNSVNKPYNYITINKGRKNGIKPQMAVICNDGIVGIVEAVSDNYAIVISALNKNFKLSAKFKKNNYFGSFEWPGSNYRYGILTDIPLHVNIVKGDTIVTSGFSAIFPEGIPVGIVEEYSVTFGTFYNVNIRLLTDFKNLFYVYVIEDKDKFEKLELEKVLSQ